MRNSIKLSVFLAALVVLALNSCDFEHPGRTILLGELGGNARPGGGSFGSGGGDSDGNVKFSVTFDSNGGSKVSPDQINVSFDSGNAVPATAPEKNGNVFNGWNTQADGNGSVFGAATQVSRNIIVYASWAPLPPNPVYLVFDKTEGTYEASPHVKVIEKDTSIGNGNMPENPFWEGHDFDRWTMNKDGSGPKFTDMTQVSSDMTLYAQWKEKTYIVRFDLDYTPSTPPAAQTGAHGRRVTEPPDPTRTGYDFDGWFLTISYLGGDITRQWIFATDTVTGDITLKARWKHSMPMEDPSLLSSFLEESVKGFNEYDPIKLSLEIDLGDMASPDSEWQKILKTISNAKNEAKSGIISGKYVNLDLSRCTLNAMPGKNTFTPWRTDPSGEPAPPIGEQFIVELTLPNTAEIIPDRIVGHSHGSRNTEYAAFHNFKYLEGVHGPGVKTIGDYAFGGYTLYIDYNFQIYNVRLARVDFPKARTIGEGAFQYTSLITITEKNFPQVITIGYKAFLNCEKLIGVTFLEATATGDKAFEKCRKLSTVFFPKAKTTGTESFSKCENLTVASADQFPVIITIDDASFSGSGLVTVNLPATTIGSGAFGTCENLRSVNLPNATTIGDAGFHYCTYLETVDLPMVEEIVDATFRSCYNLKTVNLPKVKKIAEGAFMDPYDDESRPPFRTITLGASPPVIEGIPFDDGGYYWIFPNMLEIVLRVPTAVVNTQGYKDVKNALLANSTRVKSVTLQGY